MISESLFMLFRPVRFCLNFIGITLAFGVSLYAIEIFAGVEFNSSASSIIPLMMAGMLEGQSLVKRAQGRPLKRAMWRAALGMTWFASLLSLVLLAALFVLLPDLMTEMGTVPMHFWAIFLVVMLVMQILVLRFAFGLGVKTQMRALATPT